MPKICILFHEVPPGTSFQKGHYSYVSREEGEGYIKNKFGEEYLPAEKKIISTVSITDLPDDFPGRQQLIKAGICFLEMLPDIKDFKQIKGIGAGLETKIKEYLDGNQ
jgi:hypothetical protein